MTDVVYSTAILNCLLQAQMHVMMMPLKGIVEQTGGNMRYLLVNTVAAVNEAHALFDHAQNHNVQFPPIHLGQMVDICRACVDGVERPLSLNYDAKNDLSKRLHTLQQKLEAQLALVMRGQL